MRGAVTMVARPRLATEVLALLGIERNRKDADEFTTTCPQCSRFRRKKKAECLSVKIDADRVLWRCHHCGWRGGERLTGDSIPRGVRPKSGELAAPRDAGATNLAKPATEPRTVRAAAIWGEAREPRDTLVERYLAGRGLKLFGDMPSRLVRFHSDLPWKDDDGNLIRVRAMITAMRDIVTDELCAVQCTALTADGAKLGRRMRGGAAGCAIKLTDAADVTMGLGIAEGFETALAVTTMGWGPMWALGSAVSIETFPVLPGIEELTIFADNDDAGQAAARACASRWRDGGADVTIWLPSASGDDWNEVVKKAA